MNQPTTIEAISLVAVHGGQSTTVTGTAKTPTGFEAGGSYSSTGTPERRSDYTTCLNDQRANCGILQSAQSCQSMVVDACKGFKGSPTNPE